MRTLCLLGLVACGDTKLGRFDPPDGEPGPVSAVDGRQPVDEADGHGAWSGRRQRPNPFVLSPVPQPDAWSLADTVAIWERTGGDAPTACRFASTALALQRQPGLLSSDNSDLVGAAGEFYDFFRSDQDGEPAAEGQYLTIEASFEYASGGGALNVAEVALEAAGAALGTHNFVSSFEALGPNQVPSSVGAAVDGNLGTHTTLGSTTGEERLRLTIGIELTE